MGVSPSGALCITFIVLTGTGQPGSPTPPTTAAEVIVKFRPQTDADRTVNAAAGGATDSKRAVAELTASLGKDIKIPLEFKRVGSGGTVLLAVSSDELLTSLAARIREQRAVKTAEVRAATVGSAGRRIAVEFRPGTDEARAVSDAPKMEPDRTAAARALAVSLGKMTGFALEARFGADGDLLVCPAMPELMEQLAARLTKRADVQYAQPNYTVRRNGRGER